MSNFRPDIYKRSTEELLEIISSKDEWNPEAVKQAKEELRKREVSDNEITHAKYIAKKTERIEMQKRAKESFSIIDFLLRPIKTAVEILFSWELKKEGYTKKATQQKWIIVGILILLLIILILRY
jgi:hypothetical protein